MTSSSSTTPDGRTVVTIKDDAGQPYKFVSNVVSVRGSSEFNEVIAIPLTRDDSLPPPRPDLTRGQIFVTGQSAFNAAVHQYALAEINVIGYVGSRGTVIARFMLGGDADVGRVTFEEDDTFDKIGISARQIVDGVPSTDSTNVSSNNVAVVAYMWS